jgi:hypothetical protein
VIVGTNPGQTLRKIHIAEAKKIADRVGAEIVVVLAFKGDTIVGASYGQTKVLCNSAGIWMDSLIDELGKRIPTPFDELERI